MPREQNTEADALVNAALDRNGLSPLLFWYVGLSIFGVATIFSSTGIDYRLDRRWARCCH